MAAVVLYVQPYTGIASSVQEKLGGIMCIQHIDLFRTHALQLPKQALGGAASRIYNRDT